MSNSHGFRLAFFHVAIFCLVAVPVSAQVMPRIIGGGQATEGDYPWMAALVEKGETPARGQLCGGMLVAPRWVLTAAHCVDGESRHTLDIWVGLHDLRETAGAQKRGIQAILRHPNYRSDRWDNLFYDIALILLDQPVTGVTPIQLASQSSHNNVGSLVRALGWGATHPVLNRYPNVLREVELEITDLADSQADYQNSLGVSHLAAAVPDYSRDTCSGDSGGPLFLPNGGSPILVGVVSFGDGCAEDGIEGIYANVLFLRPWIVERLAWTENPPEMSFRYRGRSLVNGDQSASRFEGTDFGRVRVWSRGKKRTYRIQNDGAGLLSVTNFRVPNSQYRLVNQAPSLVGPGRSPAVKVKFTPRRRGRIVSNVRLNSDDPANPVYRIRLIGRGR